MKSVMKIMLDEGAKMPKKAHATDIIAWPSSFLLF